MENNKNGWTDSGKRTHVCVKSAGPELNLPEGWLWFPMLSWDLLICALCTFSFQRSDPSGGFANKAKNGSERGGGGGLALLLICKFYFSLPVTFAFHDLCQCGGDDLGSFAFNPGLGSCFSAAFLPGGQFGKFTDHCVLLFCSSSVRLFIWKWDTMTGFPL